MRLSLVPSALLLLAACDAPQATTAPSASGNAKTSAAATGARPTATPTATAPASAAAAASDAPASPGSGGAPAGGDATAGKAVEQKHGGEYWAVYAAKGGKQDEPAPKASIDALKKRGLEVGKTFGWGSLGCDLGSAAALKEKDDTNAVGVYFASEADAKAFAATLQPAALGVVKIKAMCRD